MGKPIDSRLGPAALAATAFALGACAAHHPYHAAATPPPPPGRANIQPESRPAAVPDTPTASRVVIAREIREACNIPDGDAYFAFDSSQLTGTDLPPLDAVARCFTTGPLAGKKLHLIGHADPRGTNDYNLTLGQSRADVVALYLTAHGLSPANADSTSRGELDATGVDEAGWARDRRVDVTLAK